MKPVSLFLYSAALATLAVAKTAPPSAYLWTVDTGATKQESNQVSTASSDTAAAIIARRRGLEEQNYITVTDDGALSDINSFGGYQMPLFASGNHKEPAKVFIRLTDFEGTVSSFNSLPDLWIEEPTKKLLTKFSARHEDYVEEPYCEHDITPKGKKGVEVVYTYKSEEPNCLSMSELNIDAIVLTLMSTVPTSSTISGSGITKFLRTLKHLSAVNNLQSTVLVLPPASKLSKPKTSTYRKRQQNEEEPLSFSPTTAALHTSSTLDTLKSKNTSSNHTLPFNIPLCFKTSDNCTSFTNDCSGHGECVKARDGCYKCQCSKTTVREGKTISWGGNACQKKDISVEFALFAFVGVFFTLLVAGIIAMLFNMGSEKLPSVIGAGVVGPRAQK